MNFSLLTQRRVLSVHTHFRSCRFVTYELFVWFFFFFFRLQIQNLIQDISSPVVQVFLVCLFSQFSLLQPNLINLCGPSTQLKNKNISSNLHLAMRSSLFAYSCLFSLCGLHLKWGKTCYNVLSFHDCICFSTHCVSKSCKKLLQPKESSKFIIVPPRK